MNTPKDLLYAASHEWLKIEGDEALIGITDFAQEQLGDLTFADLPSIGAKFNAGQEFGSLESVKAASEIYMPVAGTIIAVNETLEDSPELINSDPYTDGWLVRIKLDAKPEGLLSAEAYEESVNA
ncbi:glycine cleavage system protein GcvH [Desulfovibrio litoralis]|uniref:Glycine cleavage system H protein n=1 Tax=Desulfovibrio litoralis DSM 11393 TaxID=1121455 RepID=A0A1M7TK38_9BACT|nr:glycine cleavage system protein GcvH [Desulfovibrio litoralis]SHN71122.1 glycine cleavage system H protein [Desulfovibrio litoralis DSM 11393]